MSVFSSNIRQKGQEQANLINQIQPINIFRIVWSISVVQSIKYNYRPIDDWFKSLKVSSIIWILSFWKTQKSCRTFLISQRCHYLTDEQFMSGSSTQLSTEYVLRFVIGSNKNAHHLPLHFSLNFFIECGSYQY